MRSLFITLLALIAATLFASRAGAQPPPPTCGPSCPTPVIVFNPAGGTDTLLTHTETIDICGAGGSDSAAFNGTPITSQFTWATSSCSNTVPNGVQNGQNGTAYTLLVGSNTFYVHACNNAVPPVCTSSSTTISHAALAVTPKGTPVQSSPNQDTSQVFYVHNYMSGTITDSLTATCSGSGLSSCHAATTVAVTAGTPAAVTVTYHTAGTGTSGTIRLKAKKSGNSDSGSVAITVAYGPSLQVSTVPTNQDDQDMSRCAASCFTNVISRSTPAYISRDAARSIGLVYNSANVTMRPILAADVSFSSASYSAKEVKLSAQYYNAPTTSWVNIGFFHSDAQQVLHFNGPTFAGTTQAFRIGGQFDASGITTMQTAYGGDAVYKLRLTITALYNDGHQEQIVDSTHHLLLVNTRQSPIANGWAVAGLMTHGWSVGNSDNTYQVESDGGGSARLYGPDTCGAICTWQDPAGTSVANRFHYDNGSVIYVDYPDSSRVIYRYDGLPTTRIGRMNDTVFYTYDTQNRLNSISDPYRLQPSSTQHTYWAINYGSHGISSIVEPGTDGTPGHGRTTTFTVDTNHFLRVWKDPDGDSVRFSYDSVYQRLDSVWDRNQNLTTYVYDTASGVLTQMVSPAVPIDASSSGTTTSTQLTTTYSTWQLAGVPTSLTSDSLLATPVPDTTIRGSVTTPAGQVSTFTPDHWGQPMISVDPAHDTTKYGRNANGFATSVTHPTGRIDSYVYSGPFLTSSTPAGLNTTNYKYGAYAQVDTISGSGVPTQAFFLSTNARTRGHVDSMAVGGQLLMKYLADTLGRDTTAVDTLGHATVYRYDATTGNRNTVLSQNSGRFTSWTFDGYGRTQTVSQSGPLGMTTLSTTYYDTLNRVDSVSDGLHSTKVKYAYDGLNDTSLTDQNGNHYRMSYNALGWLLSQTDPTSRTVTTTYNLQGLPATTRNRRGQLSSFYYDSLGRLRYATQPTIYTNQLDAQDSIIYRNQNLTVITNNGIETEAKWFSATTGLLDSTVTSLDATQYKRIYGYDGNGRRTSDSTVVHNGGGADLYTHQYFWNSTFGYLDSLRLINPSSKATTTVKFHYNAEFIRDQTTYPSSVVRYDTTTDTHMLLSSTWQNLGLYRGYGYDSTGRLVEEDINARVPGDTLRLFTYDNLGELNVQQLGIWGDSLKTCQDSIKNGYGCHSQDAYTIAQTQTYVFDATGNLDSLYVGSADTGATLASGNRLTGWTGSTFAVDSDGNRLSTTIGSNTTKYVWEANGQLAGDTVGSANRQYVYDARGRLTRRQTNGHTDRYYLWDDDQLLAILDSSAKNRISEFVYLGTDQPLARITGTSSSTDTVHFYAQDALGNVFAQFKGTTVEQKLNYDPWGRATVADTTQPLRWKGLLYESGPTSLYYVRARWYDPVTRRFISPDPLGLSAGINQYAFAGGDPINGSDPSGMSCADPDDGESCNPEGGGGAGDASATFDCVASDANSANNCWAAAQAFVTSFNSDPYGTNSVTLSGSSAEDYIDAVLGPGGLANSNDCCHTGTIDWSFFLGYVHTGASQAIAGGNTVTFTDPTSVYLSHTTTAQTLLSLSGQVQLSGPSFPLSVLINRAVWNVTTGQVAAVGSLTFVPFTQLMFQGFIGEWGNYQVRFMGLPLYQGSMP